MDATVLCEALADKINQKVPGQRNRWLVAAVCSWLQLVRHGRSARSVVAAAPAYKGLHAHLRPPPTHSSDNTGAGWTREKALQHLRNRFQGVANAYFAEFT